MTGSDDSGWSVQQQGRRTVLGYEFIAQKEKNDALRKLYKSVRVRRNRAIYITAISHAAISYDIVIAKYENLQKVVSRLAIAFSWRLLDF